MLAINALQFAAVPASALREVHRVLRPGGRLAIGGFAAPETCQSTALHLAMESLVPPERQEDHAPYALAAPGALEAALADAGLTVTLDREQPGDWRYADLDQALRGVLSSAGGARAIGSGGRGSRPPGAHRGAGPVPHTGGGTYVMHNRFRLLVARARRMTAELLRRPFHHVGYVVDDLETAARAPGRDHRGRAVSAHRARPAGRDDLPRHAGPL